MRFLFSVVLCALFLGLNPVFAAEVAPVVESSAPTSFSIMNLLTNLVSIFGHVLALILTCLIPFIVKTLMTKLNINITEQMMEHVENAAMTASAAAEEWAMNQKQKPTGNEKLDQALKIIKQLMKSDIVQQFTDEKLKEIIHSVLCTNRGLIEANTPDRA